MEISEMRSFFENYRTFKKRQFGGQINNEKVEKAERELNDKITALQQEIESKRAQIADLQKTKEWKRYSKAIKHSGLHYIFLYVLSLLVIYCLSEQSIYPFKWIPNFFVLNYDDIVTLLWKSLLFGVLGLLFVWNLLSLNVIFTFIPRIIARKQLKTIDALKEEKKELENSQKECQEKLEKIHLYKYMVNEIPVAEIINGLNRYLLAIKDGAKSATMYQEFYPWVDFFYDIGYPEAEKYEYIILACEEKVWLTPKEQQEYCRRRMNEIQKNALSEGKYYSSSQYEMKYHYSGLPGIDPSVSEENSSKLTDDDAWHAVASGMMGGPGIDSTGM